VGVKSQNSSEANQNLSVNRYLWPDVFFHHSLQSPEAREPKKSERSGSQIFQLSSLLDPLDSVRVCVHVRMCVCEFVLV
jgi:hypothetical protein